MNEAQGQLVSNNVSTYWFVVNFAAQEAIKIALANQILMQN
jgi:hypothetical protein